MTGWIHVREGDEGEVRDTSLAHASTWRYYDPHGILSRWVQSEIVWNPEHVRDTPEDYFEGTLAHELGHVLGLSHAPSGSGFVMVSNEGAPRPWSDRERWLSQWANSVGPNVQYPGFARIDDPSYALDVSSETIGEAGGTSTVTVSTGGIRLDDAQTIALSFAGSATRGTDYRVDAESLTLGRGRASVFTTLRAVDDREVDPDETIEITATLNGEQIGSTRTVTITDDDKGLNDGVKELVDEALEDLRNDSDDSAQRPAADAVPALPAAGLLLLATLLGLLGRRRLRTR